MLPLDIRSKWLLVVKRLQSVARRANAGAAIIQITVVVDKEGDPVFWTNPKKVLLEPKGSSESIVEMLLSMQGDHFQGD